MRVSSEHEGEPNIATVSYFSLLLASTSEVITAVAKTVLDDTDR